MQMAESYGAAAGSCIDNEKDVVVDVIWDVEGNGKGEV